MFDDNLIGQAGNGEFSVTEISNKIKWLLDNNFGCVRVRGEISGLKIAASGHGYFNLKDNNSVLAATCWRHNLANIKFTLTEGLEITVTGKITAYAGQSKYQISADKIEPAGDGAFMKLLKERRERLEKEGLFAAEHKQKLPFLPHKIGIITSISGAVIKDIIHRISDRCGATLIIWPVTVQGESAAGEVTDAINGFNQFSDDRKPDLLIIARGGGSIEDLWTFNEENVVRAAFNSRIPIISAVGHETDYTLLDLVADVRAPTPTAAAEFAVPVLSELTYTVNSLYNNITSKVTQQLKYNQRLLAGHDRILQYPSSYIANFIQKIDDLSFRLSGCLPNLLKQKRIAFNYLPITRFRPDRIINYKILQITQYADYFLSKKGTLLNQFYHKLDLNSSLLQSLDYNNVLKRGFAMIKDENDQYISSSKQAKALAKLRIKLHDGEIRVVSIE